MQGRLLHWSPTPPWGKNCTLFYSMSALMCLSSPFIHLLLPINSFFCPLCFLFTEFLNLNPFMMIRLGTYLTTACIACISTCLLNYTLYIINYTLYIINYTLYIIHYTLYSLRDGWLSCHSGALLSGLASSHTSIKNTK
jgi:hypothetical protein